MATDVAYQAVPAWLPSRCELLMRARVVVAVLGLLSVCCFVCLLAISLEFEPDAPLDARGSARVLRASTGEAEMAAAAAAAAAAAGAGAAPLPPSSLSRALPPALPPAPVRPACSIHSLPVGSLAPSPGCDVRNFTVNGFNGVLYLRDYLRFTSVEWFLRSEHITQSQQAGPWYVHEAVRRLAHEQPTSLASADRVLVDDLCFVLWWIAHLHTSIARPDVWRVSDLPGGELVALYQSLLRSERWQRTSGADFVFFIPHADFQRGLAEEAYTQLICSEFRNATFIVVERLQRFKCSDFRSSPAVVVAPYCSNSKYQQCPPQPSLDKPGFLFYKGRCTPPQGQQSEGIWIRHKIVRSLLRSPGINIECTDAAGVEPESHAVLLDSMARYVFCLCVPGDNHSSGRLVDAMLTGCIPVFVGPPFHALPFTESVDYASFAVFLNYTHQQFFTGGLYKGEPIDFVWELPSPPSARPAPLYSAHPDWWMPDIDVRPLVTPIDDYEEIAKVLRAISPDSIRQRQQQLQRYVHLFCYSTDYTQPSATQHLLDLICACQQQPASPSTAAQQQRSTHARMHNQLSHGAPLPPCSAAALTEPGGSTA